MIREQALAHLKTLGARPGETVEFSWFVFRLTQTGGELDIEALDFEQTVAAFTKDFQLVDKIHSAQMQVLREEQAARRVLQSPPGGSLLEVLRAGSPHAFISRVAGAGRSVGVVRRRRRRSARC